jgi:hypothetical protein
MIAEQLSSKKHNAGVFYKVEANIPLQDDLKKAKSALRIATFEAVLKNIENHTSTTPALSPENTPEIFFDDESNSFKYEIQGDRLIVKGNVRSLLSFETSTEQNRNQAFADIRGVVGSYVANQIVDSFLNQVSPENKTIH